MYLNHLEVPVEHVIEEKPEKAAQSGKLLRVATLVAAASPEAGQMLV